MSVEERLAHKRKLARDRARSYRARQKLKVLQKGTGIPSKFLYNPTKPFTAMIRARKKWKETWSKRRMVKSGPNKGKWDSSSNYHMPTVGTLVAFQKIPNVQFEVTHSHMFANHDAWKASSLEGTGLTTHEELEKMPGFTKEAFDSDGGNHVYQFSVRA
eukprot:CAMPEP_0181327884 /NCGR_PEP_ID=MMETSP1101-20121128/22367_1 /TAXON_ID=46948 /ORGANISM="Rhodomonas abbreviata, Strain Caron Lab Isolate" /LENGTH=158 /DNA_ID=CAMNT_0023436629 /DNA_START=106 /DNA_END=578 /DNA_ORIENTATION=+